MTPTTRANPIHEKIPATTYFFASSFPVSLSAFFSADGSTKFTPSASGKHRYMTLDAAQKERVLKTYVELASAKPVVRAPRFPRQQQLQQEQQKKAAEPKQP